MADCEKYTPEQIIEALTTCGGFVSVAARRLGCTFQTIYNYRDRYKEVRQALLDIREGQKDFAEGKLLENIKKGKETSLIFYLKTQAVDRGYVERHEITGLSGEPIEVKMVEHKSKGPITH